MDETLFLGGKSSFRVGTAKAGILVSEAIPVADNRDYEVSLWVLTEGTTNPGFELRK